MAGAVCLVRPVIGGVLPGAQGIIQINDVYKLKHMWRGYVLVFQSDGKHDWVDSLACESSKAICANEFKDTIDRMQDTLLSSVNDSYVTCVAYIYAAYHVQLTWSCF